MEPRSVGPVISVLIKEVSSIQGLWLSAAAVYVPGHCNLFMKTF